MMDQSSHDYREVGNDVERTLMTVSSVVDSGKNSIAEVSFLFILQIHSDSYRGS